MADEKRAPARHDRGREPKRKRRAGRIIGTVFKVLGTLILIGMCTAVMIGAIFKTYVETTLTPTLSVNAEDYTMNLSSKIYYEDRETGEWVEFQKIHAQENRVYVELEQMPDALWQAAVAIEDERFFQHNGVDWWRTGAAVANMFIGMKDTFGGSTITQQMLKNMTEDNDPTVNRKVREIFRALEFEKNNTKEEILELYLNRIYLGQGCYGVQTAAEFYFGKDVSELSIAECASLIAITNNPSLYGPMYNVTYTQDDGTTITPRELNKKRQLNILDKMRKVGRDGTVEKGFEAFITEEEYQKAKAEVLQFTDGSVDADSIVANMVGGIKINSWFVDEVIRDVTEDLAEQYGLTSKEASLKLYNGGYNVYTTIDPRIQGIAESVYEDRANLDVTSRSGQQLQSGITIIDPHTGNIVATVGEVGIKDENLGWSYATGRRQVGSSIKPLTVYAPALDSNAVTLASTFDNYPVRLLEETPWPKNSPQVYSGWSTLSYGVAQSLNTVAVQVLEKMGVTESYVFATENLHLGLVPADMDVSPLGLGGLTNGLSTKEMAAAYAAFPNNGVYNEPRTYIKVTDSEGNVILENSSESSVAMKETTAYFMNQLLQNAVNTGTGYSAKFNGMNIAGKTGTTSENYDRYFVGYTPYYCAAVWTGYDQPEKIVYTGNPAIVMWKKVMEQVHEGLENKAFDKPTAEYVTTQVCADSGMLATEACAADVRGESRVRTVTVLAGTEPTEDCTLHIFQNYCTEGKCLATSSCWPASVTQVGVINHVRVDYFDEDGNRITAKDDPYLLVNMQKAIGMIPDITADGTEFYSEIIGCPAHGGYHNYIPTDPDSSGFWEPSIPPVDLFEGIGGDGVTEPEEPGDPQAPQEPEEQLPREPGAVGDWFNSLWGG